MEMTEHALLEVRDASAAGHARRVAADLAQKLGFSEAEVGRLSIIVTEAATNLVKHAGGGELLLRTLGANGTRGVGLLTLDRGPGFSNLSEAMRDGFSSSGGRIRTGCHPPPGHVVRRVLDTRRRDGAPGRYVARSVAGRVGRPACRRDQRPVPRRARLR